MEWLRCPLFGIAHGQIFSPKGFIRLAVGFNPVLLSPKGFIRFPQGEAKRTSRGFQARISHTALTFLGSRSHSL